MNFHPLMTLSLTLGLAFAGLTQAAGEQEPPRGPQGGILLQHDDGLALEVTIYESGIPPEMRVYAYRDGNPLDPSQVSLEVALARLGGDVDQLRFTPEQDYLVGDMEVTEPHSFDVAIDARAAGKQYGWQYPSHEGRVTISPRQQALAGLGIEPAGPAELVLTDTLFGVVSPVADKVYRINAPYPSLVQSVAVQVGDKVEKGQVVATLRNTQTLQDYNLTSPAAGEVTARYLNIGDNAQASAILEIIDLSQVWVELSAFPESIEKLAIGQRVTVYDLHHHEAVESQVDYIAPQMTGGHIARARATIANPSGHWRPGMHLKADVETDRFDVPLAVRNSALQTFREMPVVFGRFGDTFEVRMIQPGRRSLEYTEVLGGLKPGTEYVTENSFLIKADILKDGASHDH